MTLAQRLLLFVLAAAVVPLAFAGFWLLREAERELSLRLEREQRALAAASAEAAGTQLAVTLESLASSASLIDWSEVTEEEAAGGLRLLSSQAPGVVAAALYAPARPGVQAFAGPRAERPQLSVERASLLALLPLATLGAAGDVGQLALGSAQDSAVGPWMPAAIQVGPRGPTAPMLVLALTLRGLESWLETHAPSGATLEIIDADARVIASSRGQLVVARLTEARQAALHQAFVTLADEQLASAPVPGRLGLVSVVSVPLDEARAPVRALRRSGLLGLGVTLALLVLASVLFSGTLARRLTQLSSVAEAFGRGELGRRVVLSGDDELTRVGQTFNAMGAELEASRAKLLTWNDELTRRVEQATAELRAAQARLLEAQKLAAIGQLGAGVAHEINNPLVGILGNAQLLLMDTPEGDADFALLKQIEESAHRCREITQQLLRFSQKRGEVSPAPMDLVGLVRRVAAIERERDARIPVEVTAPDGRVEIDGDVAQLEQVLTQLCANARVAMREAARRSLSFEVVKVPGGATLTVRDTGKGISPAHLPRVFEPFFSTKDVWTNIGLGLAVAWRVMEEHEGSIEVHSAPGEGATFTLTFKDAGGTAARAVGRPAGAGGVGKGVTG